MIAFIKTRTRSTISWWGYPINLLMMKIPGISGPLPLMKSRNENIVLLTYSGNESESLIKVLIRNLWNGRKIFYLWKKLEERSRDVKLVAQTISNKATRLRPHLRKHARCVAKSSPDSTSRWATTGNRLLPLWVFKKILKNKTAAHIYNKIFFLKK